MIMTLAAIGGDEIATLDAHPGSTEGFMLAAEGLDPAAEMAGDDPFAGGGIRGRVLRGLIRVVAGRAAAEPVDPMPDLWKPATPPRPRLDLDKAWHGVHWLLAGDAETTALPAGVLLGGREIGEDIGYGPLRVATPAETQAVADHLVPLDRAALETRLDPAAMAAAELYPGHWTEDPTLPAEVLDRATETTAFIVARAKAGEGLAIWLS
ncbi:MAG: DUF1877 family protein [Pseudomonadota bacterium]